MKPQETTLDSFQIMGIKTRTSNSDEAKGAGKIQALWNTFFSEGVTNRIPEKSDTTIFAVYHDYESDATAPYSLLIGLKVPPGAKPAPGLELITIPKQKFSRFTTRKGEMPNIVIEAWQNIWSGTGIDKLNRKYSYDFETYDSRAADPKSSEVDIFIAVD